MVRSLVIAAAVLSGSPVLAQEMITTHKTVSYADLDLGNAAGRATLRQRIARAVDAVCGRPEINIGSPYNRSIQRCRNDARNDADGRVTRAIAAAEARPGIVLATADTN